MCTLRKFRVFKLRNNSIPLPTELRTSRTFSTPKGPLIKRTSESVKWRRSQTTRLINDRAETVAPSDYFLLLFQDQLIRLHFDFISSEFYLPLLITFQAGSFLAGGFSGKTTWGCCGGQGTDEWDTSERFLDKRGSK